MDKDIAAAAIERLEAEKQRRIDEKVARGEAVRVPLYVVVGGPEEADEQLELAKADKVAELRAAGERREIVFDEPMVLITGVPRCDEDYEDPPIAKAPRPEDFHARRQVSEALSAVSKPAPSTPAPRSVEEPAEPLVTHRIHVQVAPPTDNDPGSVIEGSFTVSANGTLRVYGADSNLLGTEHLRPEANAGAAARRVLREKKAPTQFWGPIPYSMH
jgi:hypothetical protein